MCKKSFSVSASYKKNRKLLVAPPLDFCLNLLAENPSGFVLLLVEGSQHSLNLVVAFEHCVCLGILKAQFAEVLNQIAYYKRVHAAILVVGAYAYKQQLERFGVLQEHSFEYVPPTKWE